MRVYVSGIAGFLGSHLAKALIAEGHEVDGNDNLICGDEANVPKTGRGYVLTDCCNFDAMLHNFRHFQPDVVVHCAATACEGLSTFSPSFITKNIFEASVSTFSAAISSGVTRIIYMSSMARYGLGLPPFKETDVPSPVDPYGIAKVAAEDVLKVLCNTHNVKYSILVPHNVVGVGQKYDDPMRNVASIMMNRCLQKKAPIIYGDGSHTRCFSPIEDCLPSIMRAINGDADGEIVNIGPDSGEISIRELCSKICMLTGYDGEPVYYPDRPNEVANAFCSSEKARKLLGYEPINSLDNCLKDMIKDIKSRGTKEFDYSFPIEIVTEGTPKTWTRKLI